MQLERSIVSIPLVPAMLELCNLRAVRRSCSGIEVNLGGLAKKAMCSNAKGLGLAEKQVKG